MATCVSQSNCNFLLKDETDRYELYSCLTSDNNKLLLFASLSKSHETAEKFAKLLETKCPDFKSGNIIECTYNGCDIEPVSISNKLHPDNLRTIHKKIIEPELTATNVVIHANGVDITKMYSVIWITDFNELIVSDPFSCKNDAIIHALKTEYKQNIEEIKENLKKMENILKKSSEYFTKSGYTKQDISPSESWNIFCKIDLFKKYIHHFDTQNIDAELSSEIADEFYENPKNVRYTRCKVVNANKKFIPI